MFNNFKLKIAVFTIIILTGIFFFFYSFKKNVKEHKDLVGEIREQLKPGTDSLYYAIRRENYLNNQIIKDINVGDFSRAYLLMDSLPSFGKDYKMQLYQGIIYKKQKKYKEAINTFTLLLEEDAAPIIYEERAKVYLLVDKPDSALADYKNAASINDDYELQVANTFILLHKKDSALKYYRLFSEHHPNDSLAAQKIKLIALQK